MNCGVFIMLKAIVMDMDGTLLDPNNKILPETKEALISCEKKGIKLILASGRSYTRLLPYAYELEMEKYGGYLLEVDGIAYYDVQKNERHILRRMDYSDCAPIYSYLMTLNLESMCVFDDGLFDYIPESIMKIKKELRKKESYPSDFPWTAGPWSWLADMRDGYPKITYIQSMDEITFPVNKIQIIQDEEELEEIYEDIYSKFNSEYEMFRTCPREIEILPKGYSKGKTLERLMNEFNWNRDEVFTFGDGENDVSMFSVVTHSFAMGQAKEYVKEKAAHITKSNLEQGILTALKDFNIL